MREPRDAALTRSSDTNKRGSGGSLSGGEYQKAFT